LERRVAAQWSVEIGKIRMEGQRAHQTRRVRTGPNENHQTVVGGTKVGRVKRTLNERPCDGDSAGHSQVGKKIRFTSKEKKAPTSPTLR